MKLTLLRHFEVIEEYQGKYNGHIDIPLSAKGIEEAKKLASTLHNKHFDAIYCSDLQRAKQTLQQLNLNAPTTFTPLLREKSWGKHEGMSFEQIEASGITYTTFEEWIAKLDGESYEAFFKRITFFLNQLHNQKDNNILLVTHSGVIKTILAIINNLSLQESFSLPVGYGDLLEVHFGEKDVSLSQI